LHCDGPGKETDFAVDSVPDAIDAIVAAGGKVLVPPFDIQIGKCAVVLDPWGNELTILDSSKGQLTDPDGNVTGNASPEQP
jgi:predicted enzyme related to lactoylglutathione lyase